MVAPPLGREAPARQARHAGHAGPADDAPDVVHGGAVEEHRAGLHRVARRGEPAGGGVAGLRHLGVERRVAEARDVEDAQRPRRRRRARGDVGQHGVEQRRVRHAAGERAHGLEIVQRFGEAAGARDAAGRRLEAHEAGVGRGGGGSSRRRRCRAPPARAPPRRPPPRRRSTRPGVSAGSQGLRVVPWSRFAV